MKRAIDRVAIVTGAGKRIGRAIASALIDDGWRVVAHVRDGDDDVPDGAVKVVADLAQVDCAERIFAAVGGSAGLLVNNAARFAEDSVGALSADEFDAHMAVNVRAPALLIDRFAKAHAGRDGLVVNILDSKLSALNADFTSYTMSKQALAGLTELAARALGTRGIRVNGIAPALMLRSPGQTQENYDAMHRRNPLGRGVEPDDVIGALRYFIAAPCVTGQVLTIDSGQRFLNLDRDVQFLES